MKIEDIGKLTEATGDRDAIHVAVISVEAADKFWPGDKVAVNANSTAVKPGKDNPAIGVVDPFLSVPVYAEDKFWLFLNPMSTRSLRHEWEHPSFPASQKGDWQRLIGIAAEYGLSEDAIRNSPVHKWCTNGENNLSDEFWNLYQVLTGKVVDSDDRWVSCSC